MQGYAYEVTTREREGALLVYETERYEVVRCHIRLMGMAMAGGRGDGDGDGAGGYCTFRFIGGS